MEINNMDKKIIKYDEDGGLRLENNNLTEAIEKLSGTIKENCFNY